MNVTAFLWEDTHYGSGKTNPPHPSPFPLSLVPSTLTEYFLSLLLEIWEARLSFVFIDEEPFCVCLGAVPTGWGFFTQTILRVKDLAKVQIEKCPGKVHVHMYKFHVISA